MVQHILVVERIRERVARITAVLLLLSMCPVWAASHKDKPALTPPPDLLLEGGRKLTFERLFSSERDVRKKPGIFGKILNVIAGEPEMHGLVRPYSVAVDSRGRAIITDPGANGVHIFDFAQQKYKFIERRDKSKDEMRSPQCVAVDSKDNIYVTDSETGKVFVFNPDGKFQRAIGSLKGGEGFFKRPTGIAIDSAAQRIYITDTLRDKIYMLDMQGNVLQTIGHQGLGDGEFRYPTELRLTDEGLVVVDALNFRVQILDRSGTFRTSIGKVGDTSGSMFRPKGVAIDSEGHYYVADALWGLVQVFDGEGRLLYYFGKRGTGAGDFQLPAGVFIDRGDQVFVVDSYNRRIQVFRYIGLGKHKEMGQ